MSHNCSVIIPTHNRSEELKKCLKSIEKQTVLPDEVIFVDSSNNPHEVAEICENFKLIPVNYIYATAPSLTRKRNKVIKIRKGEFVFFFYDD